MSRTRQATELARVTARVAARRLRRGPQHPHWSFRYEVVLAFLRARTHTPPKRPGVEGLRSLRKALDGVGVMELRRDRVDWQPVSAGGVPAEWVLPRPPGDRVILYLHGGGYAFGSVDSHRSLLANLARTTQARVLALDYRLAPEHPCPAAIDDVKAAYAWLLEQGVSPGSLHVMGDSAGGGLTLTALMALRDEGMPLPAGMALLSPWTDLEVTGPSVLRFAHDDYLGTKDSLYAFASHYVGSLSRRDPRVSPLYGDLAGLPPMLVLAGGVEVLLDDSVRLAERAREAGVDVRLHVEPDEVHVYPTFVDLTPPARDGLARIAAFVAETASSRAARSS